MRYDTEYRIGADTSAASRNMRMLVGQARTTGAGIATGLAPASIGIGKMALALGSAGAAGALLTSLPSTIREIVEEASAIGKVADRIGIATGYLQEFRHVAGLAGLNVSGADKALEEFNKRIGEAQTGTGNLRKILEANNISMRDTQGNLKTTDVLLAEYADLIARAASAQDKAYLANEAFGRSGKGMINVLQSGRVAFQNAIQDANDLGVALDDGLIRKSEVLEDRWSNFTANLDRNFKNFVLNTVDGADQIAKALNSIAAQQGIAEQNIARLSNPNGPAFGTPALRVRSAAEVAAQELTADQLQLQKQLRQFGLRQRNLNTQLPAPPPKKTPTARTAKTSTAKAAEPQTNAFDSTVEQMERRNRLLDLQTQALAQVNPLIDDYGYATARAQAEASLLNAAQEAGLPITDELRTRIGALANQMAEAQQRSNQLAASQDRLKQSAEAMRDLNKDVTKGLVSDLRNGVSAADAFANALDKVAEKLIDVAINSAFDGKGGGGFASLFASLFGGAGATATPMAISAAGLTPLGGPYAKGGVANRPSLFGEAGPEAAVPLPDGRSIPVTMSMMNMPRIENQTPAAAPVNMQIINNTPVQVRTEEQTDPNGDRNLRVFLDDAVADTINRQGSPANRLLQRRGVANPLRNLS